MKKTNKVEKYHLLMYIVDCIPHIKKFKSTDEMGKFIDRFNKKYPDYATIDSGYWIDYAVTGVTGEVHFFTDGIKLK